MLKKREPSLSSLGSDGNTSFLRAARAGHLDKVLEHLKSNIDINTSNANGLNALHLASKDGHVEVVAELLKRGAVVDAATKKGNTALHIASLAGQEEVVKLLVQHGASVNVQSQNGFTPLYMAAQENHDNVVKYLLANGANQSLATEDGFTPLAVAMQQGHDKVVTVLLENDTRGKVRLPALHIAAKKDDVKAAKLLLENEHNPDVTSKSGFTPLHIASHYGNESIANLLIVKGADVNYAAKHNITPLHVAAKWGKTNMVALLLEKGANIESKTRDGLTPLHCAARSGHEQVVDMLLERGAPISCKTKNGLAPLHMAAQGDHVDAARILLFHRAPVDEVTVDYLTALHVAAHCGHVRVAKLLLDRQADANARALNGFTPLHIACKKNRIKVVELLLKHGASIGATTESGLTPLHVASFMGCMNIVIYLLQHDANPDVPTVRGETPLHLAARANQTDIIRILLRNGAQVDARAREQQTPLHIASRLGNVDIVMLLLQHGAKVDTTTKDMYTALHIAAKEGQDEVAAVLIENGASLNATTKKGLTPLHLAAKYDNMKVTKLLLQKEAPVDAQGKNGVTPLHVASHYDHQNVALLLLDKGASPHATAKNGHTPLHIAARKNQMDIANTLLEYGAKPNAESKAGFTPLHLSAQEGHTDMSSLLIEHEADTNRPAKNGLTALHLCAQEDRVPVAEILVKNDAKVDAATKGGFTPLHIASHYGQTNMVKFLLENGANVTATTSLGYTPLHQAAQQGHTNIVNILLENSAQPNAVTNNGQTPLHIAQKLGYISVIETLKIVTETITTTTSTTTTVEEKYKVVAPEAMQETFMSDSEEEGGEDTLLGDHSYRYLTADEMKSLGDDSLPIDVTRDERIDSNKMVTSDDPNMLPPQAIEDGISPQYITENYIEYTKKYVADNVDIARHPINIGFLVSFLVDARGGAMRGCRHSGVRVIVPPRCAPSPTRITCRYVRPQRTPHPPPLMEGEALASRVLELGPVGARFLGPVIIEVPHFAALRGKEREIVILRSDNGETWREHTVDGSEDILNEVLTDSFEAEDLNQLEDVSSGRITRILTHDFPQYFAIATRIRQEVHAIGPEGGMVSSTVVPQVQAVFPQGALTKKIKVGLQAQPIDPELTAKLLGHGVAVSPVVTVEPRRRKFHKAITLSMPAPRAHSQGMINQYSGNAPTLRLLCSITGGTTRAQWEDVTGSTPLTFVNDCVSFTTTVSARFWLMDCRNIGDATKMATELYREAIHVPFMAKFVVFAKRIDPLEARLRVFCMTDDKEDKTLEHQEHFTEVAKSRDVEVLEGKAQYIEFAGNLVPITKSGEPLQFSFRAFRENRLPFSVRVKDQHAEAVGRCLFMREPKVAKGEPPQQPICILNIVLPDDIVTETISLTDTDSIKRHMFLKDNFEYYRPDPRLSDMSNLLGEDWVPLATQLGLTPSEINVIKSEYPDSVAKQAQSMLRMWISQSGNKAQGDALENALKRIGREDIIPQCLNVDDVARIPTISKDIMQRYQKKDIDSVLYEMPKKKKESYESKYSAEEKAVEEEPSDEEDFNKTVSERRDQIQKRLTEPIIPASQQRQEIVEEITTIKRQSMVEDKIAEVETKQKPDQTKTTITRTVTTTGPETKTVVESIETTKTTESSDYEPTEVTVTKQFMEDDKPDRKTTVRTIITETRTTEHIPTNEIADRRDSELLESVTQRLETKRSTPRISTTDVDPNSPKLSKTPPPSPADFIFRDQAAAIQGWSATHGESKDKPITTLTEKDALQGILPTPTAKYLASSKELSLDSPKLEKQLSNQAELLRQANAFIDAESKIEPFEKNAPHSLQKDRESRQGKPDQTTESLSRDSSREDTSRGDDRKPKKGFFGTLRSMVSKSQDRSDSETEKTHKKDVKKKKEKKKKSKPPIESLERPPRKPKLPTPPTEDRPELRDIPFVEYSPQEQINLDAAVCQKSATDLNVPEDIKAVANDIVSEVISTGETTVVDIVQNGGTTRGKQVVIREEITKAIEPKIYESGEFRIVVSPIIPPKTRDFFKSDVQDIAFGTSEPPIRPLRRKEHIYEDIREMPATLTQDNKLKTNDFILHEINFSGWADDKYNLHKPQEIKNVENQSQKATKKQGKLFGFLTKKSSKDVEESDNEKDVIEKQDRELSKERSIKFDSDDEVEEQKKSSFFGIFGKKTKKEDPTEEREGTEGKEESTTVVTVTQEELPEVVPVLVEQLSTKAIEVEAEAVEQQEQVCTKTKEVKKSRKEKVLDESDDESEHKKSGFFGFFGKKGKRENKEEVPKPVFTELSKAVRKDMQDTTAFLEDEVKHFDDVKVFASSVGIPMQAREELKKITEPSEIFRAKPPREIKADSTSTKKSKSKDICEKRESSVSEDEAESTRKSGIFNIFGRKHKRSKSREKSPKPVSDIKLQKDVTQISHANSFLQKEVEAFDDVKPVNGFSKHLTESTQKKLSPLQEPTSMDEIKNDPISETTITRTVEKVVDEHVHSDQKKSPTKEIKEIQFKEQIRAIERTVVYEPIIRKEVVMLDDIQKEVLTLKKKAPAPDLIQTTDIRVVPFKTNNLSRASEQEDILDKQSKQPLHINEEVLMNMISTSNFLRDEIDHFDDVRCGAREPLITKEQIEDKKISRIKSATEEPESPKKGGFLGMFTRKQKPEENLKDKKKKQQMVDLCAETAQNIDECNKFLADEVTHFNDVRLVTIPKEECTSKQTEDTAALRTAKVYSDAHNQTSPSAEEFVGLISSVNNFLLGEQNNFDDVRPIIQTQSSAEKEEVLKKDVKKYTKGKKIEVVNEKDNEKSTGLFKLFGKKDKKSKEKKPTAEKGEKLPNPEINIEDSSLRKSDQVNDTIILSKDDHSQHKQPPYSEELIRTITDTQNFLTDEVTHFDDVRCIVKEQIIISNPYVKVSTKKKEEKKKKMKGDKSESGDESESSKPAYFSFAFVKKHKQDPDKEKDENVQEKKLIVKDPQIDYLKEFKILLANTGDFLDNEVARYHDVRLMTHTLQEIECKPQELQKKAVKISKKNKTDHVESEEDNDIGKAGGLFKFFGRREKKEKCEKTEMLDDQKVAAEDKITKTLTEIELQKDFVNVLVATDTFLADEIVHFEDVKPMVQRESSYEEEKTPRKENEKKKRRSYRESSESGDESDSGKSSGFFKFFSKKDKKEIEAILPEDVKGEEVEKVTTDTTKGKATAEEKPKPEKKPSKKKVKKEKIEEESHKSLFGIFGKKEKPVKATTDSAPRAISDETAQNMENSEDFLKQEINNFEDVKTLQTVKSDINLDGKMTIAEITKTAEPKVYETDDFKIVISPTQDTKIKAFSININETIEQIEKEMLSCKESGIPVSDEAPVLSIERSKKEYDDVIISQPPGKFELVTDELEVKAQMVKFASPQPPVSQETLKKMIDTSNFLNQEISRFEDVKPVTKYEHTPLSKEEEDKLSKNKPKHKQKSIDDDSKKSGFFGFFGRKEKKPDTMEAQIERIKIEEPTKEYKVATSKKILEVGEEELEESEKIVLSDELQLNIQQRPFEFQEIIHFTNNFLNNEIKNYNDVKIQGPKLEQAAVLSAEHELEQKEEKNKGKSLFGIFTRKSEERSIPDSTKEVIMKEKRERRKSGSPFKMFSKKSKDVSESEVTSSAQVQHDIYETKNFLSTEVEHYQDVKETTEKPSVTKKSVAFLEDAVFDQLEDSRAEMQQTEKVIVVIKDDVTDALTLQKNVIEAPISEELNIKYQPVLDADIDKEKSTSKEFKKSAGFLTKLGDKISGKTKDVKAVAIDNSSIDLDRVCEETKKQTEDTKTKSDALQKESLQTEAKKKSSFFTKITGKSKNIQEQIDTPIKQTSNKVETLKEDAQEVIQIPTNQTSHRIEVVQMADDKINEYTKENTDALKNLKLKFIELQESISDCSQQFLEKEIEVTSPTVTDVKDNLLEKVIKQNEYLEAPANEIEVDKKGGQSITNLPAITEAQSKDIKKPTEKTGSFFGRLGERLTGKARYDKEYVEETSQDVLDQINESVRETKEEVDKPKLEIEHEKQENDKAMEEINDDQNETVRGSLIQTKDITVRKIHDVQKGVESKTDQIKDNLPTAVEDNIRQATQKFENTKYTMDNTLVKIDKIISETGTSVTPDIEQSGLDRKTTATEVEAYGKENAEIKGSQTTLKGLDILKEQVQNFTLLEENVSYVQQQLQNEANDIENVKPKMADVLEQASSEFVDNIQSATFKDSMYKTFDDTETQPRSQHDIERSGGAKDDMSDHETPPLTVDLDQLDKTKPKDRKRRKEKRKSGGFFSKLGEKLSGKSKEVNDAVTETGDKLRETVADTPEIMEDLLSDTTEEIVAEVKKVEEFKVDIQETKDSTEVNIEHEQSIGKKEHMREDMKQSKDKTVMNYSDLEDNVTDEILNVSKFSGVKTLDIQEDIKKSNEKLQEIISGVEDKMLHTMMENVSELQTDFNRVIKQSGTPLVETSLDAKSSAQQSVELVTSEVDTAESYEDTKGASAYKIVDFLDHEKQQALETSEATTTVRIMEESIKTATKSKKHKDKKQKERKKSGGFLTGLGNKIFGGSKEKPKEASHGTAESIKPKKNDLQKAADINEKHVETLDTLQDREERVSDEVHSLKELKDESREKICTVGVAIEKQATSGTESYAKEDVAKSLAGDTKRTEKEVVEFTSDLENKEYETDDRTLHKVESSQDQETTTADVLESAKEVTVSKLKDQSETVDEILHEIRADGNEFVQDVEEHTDETAGNKKLRAEETVKHRIEEISQAGAVLDHTTAAAANYSQSAGEIVESHASKLLGATKDTLKDVNKSTKGFTDDSRESAKELAYYTQIFFSNQDDKIFGMGTPLEKTTTGTVGNMKSTGEATETKVKGLCDAAKDTVEDITGCTKYVDDGKHQTTKVVDDDTQLSMSDLEGKIYKEQVKVKYDSTEKVPKVERPLDQPFLTVIENVKSATKMVDAKVIHVVGATKKTLEEIKDSVTSSAERSKEHDRKSAQHSRSTQAESSLSGSSEKMIGTGQNVKDDGEEDLKIEVILEPEATPRTSSTKSDDIARKENVNTTTNEKLPKIRENVIDIANESKSKSEIDPEGIHAFDSGLENKLKIVEKIIKDTDKASVVGTALNQAATTTTGLTKYVEDTVKTTAKDLEQAAKDVKDSTLNFSDDNNSKIDKVAHKIQSTISGLPENVLETVKDECTLTGSELGIALEQAVTSIIQSTKPAAEIVENNLKDVNQATSNNIEELRSNFKNFVDDSENQVKKVVDTSQSFFSSLADISSTADEKVVDIEAEKVSKSRTALTQAAPNTTEFEKSTVDIQIKDVPQETRDALSDSNDSANETVNANEQQTNSAVGETCMNFSGIENKISETRKELGDHTAGEFSMIGRMLEQSAITTTGSANSILGTNEKSLEEVSKDKLGDPEYIPEDITDKSEKQAQEETNKIQFLIFEQGDKICETKEQMETEATITLSESVAALSSATIVQTEPVKKVVDTKIKNLNQAIKDKLTDAADHDNNVNDTSKERVKKKADKTQNVLCDLGSKTVKTEEKPKSESEEKVDPGADNQQGPVKDVKVLVGNVEKDINDFKGDPKRSCQLFIEVEQYVESTDPYKIKTTKDSCKEFEHQGKYMELSGVTKGDKTISEKGTSVFKEEGAKFCSKSKDFQGKRSKKSKKLDDTIADEKSSPLVTSPTLPRRAESQRMSRDDVHYCIDVTKVLRDESSGDELYIVTEPIDQTSARISDESIRLKRKPLFHLESEDSFDLSSSQRDTIRSNVLESLSEQHFETLVTDLDDYEETVPTDTQFTANMLYDEAKSWQPPTDTDLIEQKLSDIEKALGSLEQTESLAKEGGSEGKLKRVERKFERMASEVMEIEKIDVKDSKLTTPEVEERRESDFRQVLSQLSTEEVSDFQKEYAALWDEQTFSRSDEWDTSKSPDSQADVQELPQGETSESQSKIEQQTSQQPMVVTRVETDETTNQAATHDSEHERPAQDQHMLSEEMKRLLKELEEESKK